MRRATAPGDPSGLPLPRLQSNIVADAPLTPPRTAGEMLARAREFLTRKSVQAPRLEAELLVAYALGLKRLELYLQLDRPVAEREVARARELLVRRGRHEPVAQILGAREFYGRSFAVTRDVLTPRPETELIVDLARAAHRARPIARVADIGVGSGCLAVTLRLELDEPAVWAVEISAPALAIARRNAASLGAAVAFIEGDGPEALGDVNELDLLVSNPPYIAPEAAAELAPDVRDFEPHVALFTPPGDPDHFLRRLCVAARERLAAHGLALIELGFDQGRRALELAGEHGLAARTHRDYEGVERVLELRRGSG